MFNLGIQAEKIHRKPYTPMLEENNVRPAFSSTAAYRFSDALPDHLVVPGAGLEPAQTFRSEGF